MPPHARTGGQTRVSSPGHNTRRSSHTGGSLTATFRSDLQQPTLGDTGDRPSHGHRTCSKVPEPPTFARWGRRATSKLPPAGEQARWACCVLSDDPTGEVCRDRVHGPFTALRLHPDRGVVVIRHAARVRNTRAARSCSEKQQTIKNPGPLDHRPPYAPKKFHERPSRARGPRAGRHRPWSPDPTAHRLRSRISRSRVAVQFPSRS